jgi:hypothetical protein
MERPRHLTDDLIVPLTDVASALRSLELMLRDGSGLPADCRPRAEQIRRSLRRLRRELKRQAAVRERPEAPG